MEAKSKTWEEYGDEMQKDAAGNAKALHRKKVKRTEQKPFK